MRLIGERQDYKGIQGIICWENGKLIDNEPSEIDSELIKESINRAYRSFYMRPKKILTELFSESFLPNVFDYLLS